MKVGLKKLWQRHVIGTLDLNPESLLFILGIWPSVKGGHRCFCLLLRVLRENKPLARVAEPLQEGCSSILANNW